MKKTKWMKAGLAVLLASGATLAGCGDEKPKGDASSSPGGQASSASSPEVKKDITVSIYDRGIVSPEEGTVENNRWTKWMNENGPAHVNYVAIPRTNPAEKINVLYASGSAPDLLLEYLPAIRNTLYDQKQLMPIDDLVEKYSTVYKKLLDENPILRKVGTKADGKLYEFGKLNWIVPQRGILIRTDWLTKLNLKAPATTEELYEVARAFTEQDPDGNGAKDTYGLAISSQSASTLMQVFGAFSKWKVKDNQLVLSWEPQVEYHTFVKKLYDNGIIDRDFATDQNGSKAKQDFINGKIGIYPYQNGDAMNILQSLIDPLKKNVPAADVTFIPYPKSKEGAFVPTLGNPVQMTAVISATAKNPDAVMKYVDFNMSESTISTLGYGIEGVHYKINNLGVREIIDAAKYKKEVSDITQDMRTMMNSSALTFSKEDLPYFKFNSDARKEEYQKFYDLHRDTYLTLDRPYSELTGSEHMPVLPKELATSSTNADKAIGDLWQKAIVSGSKYTVEQALAEAKNIWQKSDGKAIEDWHKKWYEDNKDKALLAGDIYDFAKAQIEKYKKIKQEIK